MLRQIRRNIIKTKYGKKNIRTVWLHVQVKRYGVDLLTKLHKQCGGALNDINTRKLFPR